MSYSYKDGLREGVIFVFYKDGQILVEHRPTKTQKKETFFLNGSIELKDKVQNKDYRIEALLREINEELQGKVTATKYEYLGEVAVEGIGVLFYVYIILEWEGSIPEYTVEDNKKFADLQWIKLSEKEKYFEFDSAFQVSEMIEKFISNQST